MTEDEFIAEIAKLYRRFLEQSEPLGPEFEQILTENIEDLYEE